MAGTPEQWIGVYMNKSEEFRKKYLVFEKKYEESEKQYQEYRKKSEASLEGYRQYQKKYIECGAALEEETRQKLQVAKSNEELKGEIVTLKADYSKLEKHAKNCEKATSKAQKDEKGAKGYADHLINSQKGQLKNAERRYETAAKELKEWKDRYGESVNKPAEDLHALQVGVAEWQAKAEQARTEIAALEGQIQGTPEKIGLHQALEQWEEHQGCSKEFAELEDKLEDAKRREKKLQSELTASKQQNQKAKAANRALQTKNQLEQTTEDHQKTNNYMERIAQLESALKASTEEIKTLQENVNRLEEDKENLQIPEKIDVDMTDDDMPDKSKLLSDLKALQERHQQSQSDMNALRAEADKLKQENNAFQDYDKTRSEMVQKLESDFITAKANMEILQRKAIQLESDLNNTKKEQQKSDSNLETLQGKAIQLESELKITKQEQQKFQGKAKELESDLSTTRKQYQTVESDTATLQGKADRLEKDLKTTLEKFQTMKSDNETLQGKATQLKSELKVTKQEQQKFQGKAKELESDLSTTREQYQTMKSDNETLQGKATQLKLELKVTKQEQQKFQGKAKELESDLSTTRKQYQTVKSDMEKLQAKADTLEKEKDRLQLEASEKSGKDKEGNNEIANAVQSNIEERVESLKHGAISSKLEQDVKAQQPRIKTSKGDELSQVTPPSSPLYTTDEGSQDLEKTPRPKKSLRQDLGFSSQEHTDEEHSNVFGMQQQGIMMSKQSETGEEKDMGAENWKKGSDNAGEPAKGGTIRGKRTLFTIKHRAKNNFELRANERAKEQSEALESIFECTPAKANAIDRRLKALGPGCRLHEAPALVANELSGIPEETYKGLASGKLITTEPRNEVKDVGTNPVVFTNEVSTQTADLAPEQVADTPYSAQDMMTDTTDLPVERVPAFSIMKELRAFLPILMVALLVVMGFMHLYTGLKGDPELYAGDYVLKKHIYSERYTSFATSSLYTSAPVKFVYPPTPAPQLGLMRMMYGASRGGGQLERMW